MNLHEFLDLLHVDRGPSASGEFMCRCPAHDDKTASLCVKDGEKGIVVKCQAGCSTESVLAAMGVKMQELFYDDTVKSGSQPKPVKPQNKQPKTKNKAPQKQFVCAYPYTDEHGKLLFEACRYKLEDGGKTFLLRQPDPDQPGKYKYTKEGVRLVLYRLPEVVKAIADGKPIFICEGEKDCDNMAAIGYVATTNPFGAGKWREADYSPSLQGANVYIIPDNDGPGRDHAEAVAKSLRQYANSLYILDLVNACPELPAKGDVSDYYKLVGRVKGDAGILRLMDGAENILEQPEDPRETVAAQYEKILGYCVNKGRTCMVTREGPSPLANFVALPVAVITRDDGVNISKLMEFDGWSSSGNKLPRIKIKAAQFSGMSWVAEHWDFSASIMPGNTVKDRLRYAISEVGLRTAERITEYAHTGWRKIHGQWAYLYQGGAIGADNVTVDLGNGLASYRLDGSGAEAFATITPTEGAIVTLDLLGSMTRNVAIPLLGTVFLSPLREFLAVTGSAPAYALFVLGGTGTRKSTAVALALSHFGNFTAKSLPASFNDTANYIRKKAFLLKDAPIVVDDYHPVTSLQERKKMEATAQSLARAFGDGAERGRMRSDLTLQEAMPPRGVAIISGEDAPGVGESGMARFYVLNVNRHDIPVNETLTNLQQCARMGYLQRSMRGYIEWLIPQADELPAVLEERYLEFRTLALQKATGQHSRTPEAIAHIILGYDMMLRYMVSIEVLNQQKADDMLADAWKIVTEASRRQAEEMRDERPSKQFLAAISELLTSRLAGVRDLRTGSGGVPGTSTGHDMIGFVDDRYYYLIPLMAYRAVVKLYSEQGQAFPLSIKMLYRQMREDGVLDENTTTKSAATRPKCIDGKTERLLWIERRYIDGNGPKEEQMDLGELQDEPDEEPEDLPF